MPVDWQGALDTLAIGRRNGLIDKTVAKRRRAVLLTAQAQAAEDAGTDKALELALEAHRLAPDLVPAAAIAGRVLASRGNTPRAARVLLKTWRLSPHPELAAAYAYVRPGDSPRDRLVRVRHLGRITPNDIEAPIAIAAAAVEAREWDEARNALEPLLDNRLSQRVCTLMARIEAEQHGHTGRVREWLARAVHAPRDPAWAADGVVSDHWAPTSPVTGQLDAFRWRVPVEAADESAAALLSAKVEALVGLGAEAEPVIEHRERTQPAAETVRGETIEPPVIKPTPKPAPAPEAEEVMVLPPVKPAPVKPQPPAVARVPAPRAEPPQWTEPDVAGRKAQTEVTPQRESLGDRAKPASRPVRPRKPTEPKIFVPPRAPDDPGPEISEDDGLGHDPFGPSPAKA